MSVAAHCCDCGARFARDADEPWKVRCLHCWARRKAKASPTPIRPDPIHEELLAHLRALLMLAHPDRHNGSALATDTTQWLLSLRDRLVLARENVP